MNQIGQRERLTQNRVVEFFQNELGYRYLGDWQDRIGNSHIEEDLLRNWLTQCGHDDKIFDKVLFQLRKAAAITGSQNLYEANREFYKLLRYGVKVAPAMGEHKITVHLIDWDDPEQNDFAIAEEVTVEAVNTKRPDVVLYINGIALGVLELKRSTVSLSEGIRQNLDNQKADFIRPFFTTVQLIMAGNESQGLRYGMIEAREKFWLHWKEENPDWKATDPLDRKYLSSDVADAVRGPLYVGMLRLLNKELLLTILHDFIVFDAGIKKTCRHNQFFGVQAAQKRVQQRQGGIIWHTQGSGKSLTMVWLAKWIREHVEDARVLVITDRTELDQQIENVFMGVNEEIYRTKSGSDLVNVLNANEEWLMCSLIHKFGGSEGGDVDQYMQDIRSHLPKDFHAKGELFVFIDECHRTQSGKLHEAMKAILPEAMLIGFTGTPLLKKDKAKSIEIFGPYIHTYKFDEAVQDGVVLDLRYEARDIDQELTSPEKVDDWFETKTQGLSDLGKAHLKQRWGTLQKVLSAKSRLNKIVADIIIDMAERDRLKSGHGNAMLVASSIYQACQFYDLFQDTELRGKCAVVTSYQPSPNDIKGEETGEGFTEKLRQYEIYREMLSKHFNEPADTAMYKVEEFEKQVKKRFIEQPAQMKLLIVVDKLLTGFDAPPATYLYIDKQMQDHGLFQAICRVNRLDSEDKEYGYIVDYKDLFQSLEQSIEDYTGGAFDAFDEDDVAGLLKDRLETGKERLEEVREAIKALCEAVPPPKDQETHLLYFCGPSDNPEAVKENEAKRVALYKLTSSFIRAYANLANEMRQAGYSRQETETIKQEVEHFENLRQEVKLRSGDYVDMKIYEPAMRHLLDTYIRAEESEVLSTFDDMSLVQLIVERGQDAFKQLPKGLRENPDSMAETIENNVRKVIIDEMAVNPKYYESMSELLDDLIQARKEGALDYKAYLEEVQALASKVQKPETATSYPEALSSSGLRSLYDNLDADEELALQVDRAVRNVKKAGWRDSKMKKKEVEIAIKSVLGSDDERVPAVFDIIEAHKSEY